ncbi:protein RIC-3-like [Sinocyclocheilus rhinocerous]|uniref:protein RIC-3-like n=1 Tax=Sinocyclocheilus rhinocerous TaxID=307959 RepID=UPI0007B81A49|nr:PREDICTED: protein RIC-3-like [Sinocyclocheilus rhinocerous]
MYRFPWQLSGSEEAAGVRSASQTQTQCCRYSLESETSEIRDQRSVQMSSSTFQKLAIASCVLLCVALLLPKMLLSRGKRDAAHGEGPAGHSPPTPHRPAVSVSEEQRRFSRAHNPEAIARAKGASTGGKSNLAGQIIPIYGFGILLYILYILFKITSKGKITKPPESRFAAVRSENMKRKITDFELAQLQDRLNETKDVIERIISAASAGSDRCASLSLCVCVCVCVCFHVT